MIKILQIRIADYNGSNSVILEKADKRRYSESINLASGGISFEIAKSAPKADVLNPYTTGYTKRWEVWDTEINKLLDFGPIAEISDGESVWQVSGPGRIGFLSDFRKSKKTFYASLTDIVEDISYENVAAQPRVSTIVPETTSSGEQTTVFGNTVVINEKYHALSKQTKDNAIDDDTGRILPGKIEPSNTYYSSDSFWSGMSKADTHIIDLGATYQIKKLVNIFPDWGGPQKLSNRTYDFSIAIATDTGSTTEIQDKTIGTFTTLFSTPVPNRETLGPVYGGKILYVGDNGSGITVDDIPLDLPPVPIRYIRTQITNVRAWRGTVFDSEPSVDSWDFQCDPNYTGGALKEPINDRVLEPANDCHASLLEVGAYQEIIPINLIRPLALQRIDNNNPQIKYSFSAPSSETTTTSAGYRKFEPGGLFRKLQVTYSGASTSYNKFFDDDCSNCYPDGFNFGIMDQNNSLVLARNSTSGTALDITLPANTSEVTMKGSGNTVVTWCDSWPAKTDALSWGGSYSFNEVAGDTAIIHFRGQSFKWYATVPDDKTGAQVTVEIRGKASTPLQTIRPKTIFNDRNNTWSGWTTIASFTLPNDIAAEKVYEITYESGILEPATTYEIRITNVDGNYCSIDSIEGYWQGSATEYNEDSSRVFVNRPERVKQIYDKRFSNGSMNKFENTSFTAFEFIGDRVILLSAKGRNHGIASVILRDISTNNNYDPGSSGNVPIPGATGPNGNLEINLDTGKRGNEIPRYVLFDSDEYFTNGLPWGRYTIGMYLTSANRETYSSNTADIEFDSFVSRCGDCTPPTGDDVTVYKPIYLDSIWAHEVVGLSVDFNNETHLEILRSTIEATQIEAKANADGIRVEPRIGQDTNIMLREGENTLVRWQIVNDITQMASMLVSSGADIDGLPLFTITENKKTRARLGRTIMRQHDFRSVADYFQLIGLSRLELERRAYPQKRVSVSYIGNLDLEAGDSFLLWTKKLGTPIRVRIETKEIDESSGRVNSLECLTWPQIV